jgi:flagellar FliL protein
MAEESGQGEAGSGATAPAGRGKLLLVVAAVVLLAGGGGAAWWLLGPRGATAKPVEEVAPKDPLVGAMLPLDTFIANLADEDGKRYLKASLQVEFFASKAPEEFKTPQVRDLLLTLFSSKQFAEIRTPEGKAVLREEIINRMNRVLRKDLVKAVYFTEFIVQ